VKMLAMAAVVWLLVMSILLPAWKRTLERQKRRDAIEMALLRRQKELEEKYGEARRGYRR